ncbi:hypothetical protein [Pyrolobus fumarii]|nr:hypothetical protein [Pyrolobus fumarii]
MPVRVSLLDLAKSPREVVEKLRGLPDKELVEYVVYALPRRVLRYMTTSQRWHVTTQGQLDRLEFALLYTAIEAGGPFAFRTFAERSGDFRAAAAYAWMLIGEGILKPVEGDHVALLTASILRSKGGYWRLSKKLDAIKLELVWDAVAKLDNEALTCVKLPSRIGCKYMTARVPREQAKVQAKVLNAFYAQQK